MIQILKMGIAQEKDQRKSDTSFENLNFDDRAFEDCFKEHFKPLCVYCQYKFNFDIETAKEIVHTGFIKLWESRNHLTPSLSVKSYLYKIITNSCLDMLRHNKVKQKHELYINKHASDNDFDMCFNLSDQKQLNQIIDHTIAEMPEQMRKIFELSRYEGLKYIQIADRLNISVKTVETQISRALIRLRSKLIDYLVLIFIMFSL